MWVTRVGYVVLFGAGAVACFVILWRARLLEDTAREGRPAELSEEQHEQFVEALHESPEEVGYDAPAWSVPLARHHLSEQFDVKYCERHVRRRTKTGRRPGQDRSMFAELSARSNVISRTPLLNVADAECSSTRDGSSMRSS